MASRGRARRKKEEKVALVDLLAKPTITPEELYLSGALTVGKNGIYDSLHTYLNAPESGTGIECFRLNRRIVIPTAPLAKKLGIRAA